MQNRQIVQRTRTKKKISQAVAMGRGKGLVITSNWNLTEMRVSLMVIATKTHDCWPNFLQYLIRKIRTEETSFQFVFDKESQNSKHLSVSDECNECRLIVLYLQLVAFNLTVKVSWSNGYATRPKILICLVERHYSKLNTLHPGVAHGYMLLHLRTAGLKPG